MNKYFVFSLCIILIIAFHYVLVFLHKSPNNHFKPVEDKVLDIKKNEDTPFVEKNFEEPVDNSEILLKWLSKEGDSIYSSVKSSYNIPNTDTIESPIQKKNENTTQITSWSGNTSYSPIIF